MAKPTAKKPTTATPVSAPAATTKPTTVAPTVANTATPAKVAPKSTAATTTPKATSPNAESSKATPAKVVAKKAAISAKSSKSVASVKQSPNVTKAAEVKAEKTPKLKMERDSFTMPKAEYAQLAVLKERLSTLNQPAKKSELLRAGIMHLTSLSDVALKAALSKVPTIKTGRPKKK